MSLETVQIWILKTYSSLPGSFCHTLTFSVIWDSVVSMLCCVSYWTCNGLLLLRAVLGRVLSPVLSWVYALLHCSVSCPLERNFSVADIVYLHQHRALLLESAAAVHVTWRTLLKVIFQICLDPATFWWIMEVSERMVGSSISVNVPSSLQQTAMCLFILYGFNSILHQPFY